MSEPVHWAMHVFVDMARSMCRSLECSECSVRAYSCVPGRAGEAGRQLGRAVRCHLATDRFTPRQGSMK
jgi:hypothetical protein